MKINNFLESSKKFLTMTTRKSIQKMNDIKGFTQLKIDIKKKEDEKKKILQKIGNYVVQKHQDKSEEVSLKEEYVEVLLHDLDILQKDIDNLNNQLKV